MLADISIGLTPAQAVAAPKLFQLTHRLGEREVVKLLVVILRAFVDSLRVKEKPDAADLIELAGTLAQTYTHDSLKDIILALKEGAERNDDERSWVAGGPGRGPGRGPPWVLHHRADPAQALIGFMAEQRLVLLGWSR